MVRVTGILGLCGSGKSHRAHELDPTGENTFDGIAGDSALRAQFFDHLHQGRDAIVEEVTYCDPVPRKQFEDDLAKIGAEIVWECFENDLDKANSNVRNRTNKGSVWEHLSYNERLTVIYVPPPDARMLDIYVI